MPCVLIILCTTSVSNGMPKRQREIYANTVSLSKMRVKYFLIHSCDVIDDLKRVAPLLGFSEYQPLIRAYIGQGLRIDLERLEGGPELNKFVESLKRRGVNETIISEAISEIGAI